MKNLEKILEKIGFSEKEVAIYLLLTRLGEVNVTTLSKHTEINRTSIYDTLGLLSRRGLVSKRKKGASATFNVQPPEKLISYLDHERDEMNHEFSKQKNLVSEYLPEFISLQGLERKSRPRVTFYEGAKGMREAYEDTLTSQEPIRAYANIEVLHQSLPNFFKDYFKRRAAKKIPIRGIMPRNKKSLEHMLRNSEEMRTTRLFPEGVHFTPEVDIYNNKVLIVSWLEQMAVIIESKEYADLHKIIFDQLWDELPQK